MANIKANLKEWRIMDREYLPIMMEIKSTENGKMVNYMEKVHNT